MVNEGPDNHRIDKGWPTRVVTVEQQEFVPNQPGSGCDIRTVCTTDWKRGTAGSVPPLGWVCESDCRDRTLLIGTVDTASPGHVVGY